MGGHDFHLHYAESKYQSYIINYQGYYLIKNHGVSDYERNKYFIACRGEGGKGGGLAIVIDRCCLLLYRDNKAHTCYHSQKRGRQRHEATSMNQGPATRWRIWDFAIS